MYPFERFTEAAKRTLALAQEEAEQMHRGHVATEHLLFALLQQRDSVAGATLSSVGVSEEVVRARVGEVLGSEARVVTAQIVPTSRTKRVIEMSFHEAHAAGSTSVWTDHILLALADEGEGVAAHVLAELGATTDALRSAAARVRAEGVDESPSPRARSVEPAPVSMSSSAVPQSPPSWVRRVLTGAREEASADREKDPAEVHLFRYLLASPDERVAGALRRFGVDPARLREALRPPAPVLELRRLLDAAINDKVGAAAREDYPAAEAALQREQQVREELDAAEAAWREGLATDR